MALRRRRSRWWRRAARMAVALLLVAALLPAALLLPLRWIRPPTTAFMLRHQISRGTVAYHWTDWDAIAPSIRLAVIAAEDQRFLTHHGIDLASVRQAVDGARRGARLRGASTISQQVVKNLLLWPDRSFVRKGIEAYLTVVLETAWSKRRILEIYLNIAEFGDGVFGVGAASARFFDKRPADLSLDDAALLAAALPNPAGLRVDHPSAYLRERQAWIRRQMTQLTYAAVP